MNSEAIALDVQKVSKSYTRQPLFRLRRAGDSNVTQALKDVSFFIRQGETFGLLGPNGSGKTTLLKIIATLLEPSSGRVTLHGTDIARRPRDVRGRIGLVTCDERSFYWRLTGRENLNFFGALHGLPAQRIEERSRMLFDMLGLAHASDRPFQSYSSGMKQKLAIARGLLSEPSLILYDEPTRSLDPLSAHQIRKWLIANREKSPRQTHLIATNQLQEAEELCDRVLIINRGTILAIGSVREIRERWNSGQRVRYHVVFRGSVSCELLTGITWPSQPAVEEDLAAGRTKVSFDASEDDGRLSAVLLAILHAGGVVVDCRVEQASFDELFCSMVGQTPQSLEQSR